MIWRGAAPVRGRQAVGTGALRRQSGAVLVAVAAFGACIASPVPQRRATAGVSTTTGLAAELVGFRADAPEAVFSLSSPEGGLVQVHSVGYGGAISASAAAQLATPAWGPSALRIPGPIRKFLDARPMLPAAPSPPVPARLRSTVEGERAVDPVAAGSHGDAAWTAEWVLRATDAGGECVLARVGLRSAVPLTQGTSSIELIQATSSAAGDRLAVWGHLTVPWPAPEDRWRLPVMVVAPVRLAPGPPCPEPAWSGLSGQVPSRPPAPPARPRWGCSTAPARRAPGPGSSPAVALWAAWTCLRRRVARSGPSPRRLC